MRLLGIELKKEESGLPSPRRQLNIKHWFTLGETAT